MKKIIILFLCTVVCVSSFAVVPVSVMKLKKITPVDTYYTGQTVSVDTDIEPKEDAKPGILSFGVMGRVKSVLPVGSLVFGPIYDMNGKVIREGTVIASLYKERQEKALKAAVFAKQIAQENYSESIRNFERSENLMAKDVGTRKDYLNEKAELVKSKLVLDDKVNALELAKVELTYCDIVAPHTGIVTQIWRDKNRATAADHPIVTVQRMDPMMIKIPFPSEVIELVGKNTKVMVYPENSDKPINSWVQVRTLDKDNIYAYVPNNIVPLKALNAEQEKLPKIYKVAPVMSTYKNDPVKALLSNQKQKSDNIPLSVPEDALKQDANGKYYVLTTKFDIKETNSVNVEKVKVVPGNIVRTYSLGTQDTFKLHSLKDAGNLNLDSVVVAACTEDLDHTGKAVYVDMGWKFYPGKLLKLAIPELSKPGFYVSKNAIVHQATSENYVYVDNGGIAKLVKVKIVGASDGNYAIEGDGIKAGTNVVVLDSKEDFTKFYDGVELKVEKTLPAPERISHERANRITVPLEEIPSSYYS